MLEMDYFSSYWRFMNWVALFLMLGLGCLAVAIGEFAGALLCFGIAPLNYWMTRVLDKK